LIKRWKATIRLAPGLHQVVFVSADSVQKALLMLELQFGKERIVANPILVRVTDTASAAPRRSSFSHRLWARMRDTARD
jgi:hypothetical protein